MSIDISKLPQEVQIVLSKFPEFQLNDYNDSGANGYVLIGWHQVLKKRVAIKIYFHEENGVEQEPSIIQKIRHPNVLEVYDARIIEKNCSYFLMPAANYGDLATFLNRYNILTRLALNFLCQLLSGIAALHASPNNLVHRDLKPENLLINDDDLLIADFGSVRKIPVTTGKAPASKHSILYRPPEAFGTNAFFDYSSDIYQAGLIGFLLFGGKLSNDLLHHLTPKENTKLKTIYSSSDAYQISIYIDSCIENKIKKNNLIDLNSLPFYIPKSIKSVLRKAVSEYSKRYSKTSEFLADLSKIQLNFPDWLETGDGFQLYNWKGNDYLLMENNGKYVLKKKRHTAPTYRIDSSISGNSFEEIFTALKEKIALP